MRTKEQLFKKFLKKASNSDIYRIDKNLASMNKGQIIELWPKVQGIYKMVKDPKAPWTSKALSIATLIYLISPMDAIPDFVPILGLSDDAAIIIATLATLTVQLKKYLENKD
ncbi:Protein of unknown function [Desulfonispora thiosulfatigenes DSM 11270]|uniref:DUF1232 domain-containing protein n=1 Tax=Desulfonispora thiosulfatigenes DSM 11270 TaxID=656914 RepID=A0A1W1UH77_DESTI|nr:YkvA family protein [Desulfonispora thiosulfatigenes]SMB80455.1 Protein of unknown function [Desulfonispora thiosulfatigenes DSM 11270]